MPCKNALPRGWQCSSRNWAEAEPTFPDHLRIGPRRIASLGMERREPSKEIDDAAADWATRTDQSTLGPDGQAEFDAWLKGDVRRCGAFARARAVLIYAKRSKARGPD